MVEVKILKNKVSGEVLTTKEGKELKEFRLQLGDEFIPTINKVLERNNEVLEEGKKVIYTNYSIPAKVREANGKVFKSESEDGSIFITLTPGQAKVLNKLKLDDVELNQNLFNTYNYDNAKGTFLGIGIKGKFKEAKSFDDFEDETKEE